MRLVPVFTLETHNQTNYKCLPKFVQTSQTDNASSSIKTAICSLIEQVKSNWHGFSIPPHSYLQMSSATDDFNTDLATTCKKIPRYSGELTRQMADRLIAKHYFHGMLAYRVVKLSFRNKFFSDRWLPYIWINMMSTHGWCIALLRLIFVQIPSSSFQLWALVMKKTVVSQRE